MRIITPTGKICKVCNVEFMAEKQERFNKRVSTSREVAVDMRVKPTGVIQNMTEMTFQCHMCILAI